MTIVRFIKKPPYPGGFFDYCIFLSQTDGVLRYSRQRN